MGKQSAVTGTAPSKTLVKKFSEVRDFGVLAAAIVIGIFFSIAAPCILHNI